jgi:hypothetical protein
MQQLLGERGLQYRRVPVDDPIADEYIRVDFGQDVALASEFACVAGRELFRQSPLSFTFKAEGICPVDELVETKNHPSPRELLGKTFRD